MRTRFQFLTYLGSAAEMVFGSRLANAIGGAQYLAKGSRNWLISGAGRCVGYKGPLVADGVTGGKYMMPAAESYASLGAAATAGVGSVFRVLTALFFIGSGLVKYAGTSTGAVATSTLSFRYLENGAYNGSTYQAGLAQPSAPTVFTRTAGAGFSGTQLIQGTRAAVVWRIRSGSGAVSVASLPSNVVITTTGQTFVITFPLPDSNGQDRWGIGVPKAGFGEFGPFYELQEIPESSITTVSLSDGAITATDATFTSATAVFTADDVGKVIIVVGADTAGADLTTTIATFTNANSVELTDVAVTTVSGADFQYGALVDGVARSLELEWTDGQIAGQPLAPIDDFPPPPARFGGTLNDAGFLDGAYGDTGTGVDPATQGATIVTSLPLKFESWPPDNILYAPQAATAVSSRAADGYAYRAGRSSLGALVYTGGSPAISFQLRWPTTGCASPHNMVIAAAGRLYIWTSQQGLARISSEDEPETDWAIPFAEDTRDWVDEDVVLGWDAQSWNMCAMHAKMLLPYNVRNDRCGAPCDLTGKIRGNIISAVTDDTQLLICTNNVRTVADVTTTNGSKNISSPTAAFTADDVGMTIELTQSGGAGTLTSTITTFTDSSHVVLNDNVTWTAAGTTTASIDTTLRLYHFNAGTGMVSEAYTPWVSTDEESDGIFKLSGAIEVDNHASPVTLKVFTNGDLTTAQDQRSVYLPRNGFQHIFTERPNVTNAKSHALYLSVTGAGGDVVLDSLQSEGEADGIVIHG